MPLFTRSSIFIQQEDLNSKTNLIKTSQSDPFSQQWLDVKQVVDFSLRSGLNILAVGYTIYLGSEHEATMLHQAARIIYDAHQHGLITVLWIYPRGKAVADEKDPHLIAGATGVAACLGSDFVKVNYPKKEGYESKDADEKVAVSEWFCPGTLDNLQQNPLISFLFKHWEPMDLTTVNII
jgi:DhnA family fructose-bisphosphate aldolase class Ia